MRAWVTLALIIIVSVLGYKVYESDFSEKKSGFNAKAIYPFDVKKADSIVLTSKNSPWSSRQREILFSKKSGEDSRWNLEYLGNKPADETTIISFLNSFSNLIPEEIVTENVDSQKDTTVTRGRLKEYGLDSPMRILEIGLKDEDPLKVGFGISTSIGNQIFASITKSGKTGVYMIGKSGYGFFDKKLWDWRQKRVGRFLYSDVTSLMLKSSKSKLPIKIKKSLSEGIFPESDICTSITEGFAIQNGTSLSHEILLHYLRWCWLMTHSASGFI